MRHIFVLSGFLVGHFGYAYFNETKPEELFLSTYWMLAGYVYCLIASKIKQQVTT